MIKKLLVTLMLVLTTSSFANEYNLFINNVQGSGPDRVARQLSQTVKNQTGINLSVINITGGNGLLSVLAFKKEKLAITFGTGSTLAYLPHTLQDIPYKLSDFNIISPLGGTSVAFFTRRESPIKDLDDLSKLLPKIPKSAIGVASADGQANARAFLSTQGIDIPVVNYRNHNDLIVQVLGGHVEVGVLTMTVENIWTSADAGFLRVLGVVNHGPFVKDGKTYPSINQHFGMPAFFSGNWLAITPGNTKEHQMLAKVLLDALNHPDVQDVIRKAWHFNNINLRDLIDTADRHKELLK